MNRRYKKYNQGFAALALVTLIGILTLFFTLNNIVRGWSQDKNLFEVRAAAQVRLRALSCLEFSRLQLYVRGGSVDDVEDLVGERFLPDGSCSIDEVSRQGNRFFVRVSAKHQYIQSIFHGEISADSYALVSIQEF